MAKCLSLSISDNEEASESDAIVDDNPDTNVIISVSVSGGVVMITVILVTVFCVRRKQIQKK